MLLSVFWAPCSIRHTRWNHPFPLWIVLFQYRQAEPGHEEKCCIDYRYIRDLYHRNVCMLHVASFNFSFTSFSSLKLYFFCRNFCRIPGCWGDPRRLRLQLYHFFHFFQPMAPSNVLVVFNGRTRQERQDGMFSCSGSPQLKMKVARACESSCVQLCSWNFQISNLPEGLRLSPDTISYNSAIGVSKSWSTACALQLAMTSVSSDLFSALTELCWIGLRCCFCWYFLKEQWFESNSNFVPSNWFMKKVTAIGCHHLRLQHSNELVTWRKHAFWWDCGLMFHVSVLFLRQALRLQSAIFHLSWHVRTINIPTEHF